jgi:hypothetical protein
LGVATTTASTFLSSSNAPKIGTGRDLDAHLLHHLDAMVQNRRVHVAQGGDPGPPDFRECIDELATPAAHTAGNVDPAQPHNRQTHVTVRTSRSGGSGQS